MPWKQLELTEDDRYALRTLEKKTRFLVDENVHAEVVRFLRAHGWNVKSVDDGALRGHCDEDVLAFAHREDRILLTHDRGFLNDRVVSGYADAANLGPVKCRRIGPSHEASETAILPRNAIPPFAVSIGSADVRRLG